MTERGKVVYLHATINQQLQRTHRDQNRPLLQTDNPEQKLRELFENRDPLYREAAAIIINTDGRSIQSVTQEIIKCLHMNPADIGN